MACGSCFSGDRFHRKSYIVSTGVNSAVSQRIETGLREAILQSFSGMNESVAIHPAFEKVGFLATECIIADANNVIDSIVDMAEARAICESCFAIFGSDSSMKQNSLGRR